MCLKFLLQSFKFIFKGLIMIENMINKLKSHESFISFEITPNLGAKFNEKLTITIESIKNNDKLNAIVCTNSPLARFKPDSILTSIKLQQLTNKPLITTISMRDKNFLALASEILAANDFDIRGFLALTGDPVRLGDCAESKGVFNGNSIALLEIIRNLNAGIGINNKPLDSAPKQIYAFSATNSHSQNFQSLQVKMRKKLLSGSNGFFSQPVFSLDSAKRLLETFNLAVEATINQREEAKNAVLVFGFFPVTSLKTALFLRDKLPGVFIPDSYIQALEKTDNKDEQYKIGLDLSKKLWLDLQSIHNKFHFLSNNNYKIAEEII